MKVKTQLVLLFLCFFVTFSVSQKVQSWRNGFHDYIRNQDKTSTSLNRNSQKIDQKSSIGENEKSMRMLQASYAHGGYAPSAHATSGHAIGGYSHGGYAHGGYTPATYATHGYDTRRSYGRGRETLDWDPNLSDWDGPWDSNMWSAGYARDKDKIIGEKFLGDRYYEVGTVMPRPVEYVAQPMHSVEMVAPVTTGLSYAASSIYPGVNYGASSVIGAGYGTGAMLETTHGNGHTLGSSFGTTSAYTGSILGATPAYTGSTYGGSMYSGTTTAPISHSSFSSPTTYGSSLGGSVAYGSGLGSSTFHEGSASYGSRIGPSGIYGGSTTHGSTYGSPSTHGLSIGTSTTTGFNSASHGGLGNHGYSSSYSGRGISF